MSLDAGLEGAWNGASGCVRLKRPLDGPCRGCEAWGRGGLVLLFNQKLIFQAWLCLTNLSHH